MSSFLSLILLICIISLFWLVCLKVSQFFLKKESSLYFFYLVNYSFSLYLISSVTHWLFCLCSFYDFFCPGFLVSFHYKLIMYKKFFPVCICWGLLYHLSYYLFWRTVHELLSRISIPQLSDGMFHIRLLSPFGLWCTLILRYLCWFFGGVVWMAYLLVGSS